MIDFKEVSKIYGDTVALDSATIHIDKGDFVFIVGPTGSGKSTFIKLILKEIDPDHGDIFIKGKSLLKMSNRRYNQTLLIITHDESIALQADRIIAIEDGRITRDERIRRAV